MEEFSLSFVVPVYNVEPYLERCVNSLLAQGEGEYEILLVDDGSTDQSGAMCDRYAEQDVRIRVFHKENGGLSSARNYGLKRAGASYVVFVDSDDYVSSEMYAVLKRTVQAYPGTDVIHFGGLEECGNHTDAIRNQTPDQRTVLNGHDYLVNRYQQRNLDIQAWLYAFSRDFLEKNNLHFQDGILHEDVEFTPRMLLAAERILDIPEDLYHYIVRENSISTSKKKHKNIQDLSATLYRQCELADRQEPQLRKWMKNAALNSYLNMIYEFRMDRKEYRKYVKKSFLLGKAATPWNHLRVLMCLINIHFYCWINENYKKLRKT
jgi:glycosyltransferase involved in cell wall biosynthesis